MDTTHTHSIISERKPPRGTFDNAACMAALRAGADHLLAQCGTLVVGADIQAFSAPSTVMPGGTIGKHVRHVLDHYQALLRACEHEGATIDYDHRARDERTQTDPAPALRVIETVRVAVRALPDDAQRRVIVELLTFAHGPTTLVASTLARELAFATHHAVHHQAMIGAIAAEVGVRVPDLFGKAPATIAHERTETTRH